MLKNILWPLLAANQYGRPIWRTGSIFSCSKGLWDCLPTKPITTKQQSVFWLVSQSRRMSAICVGICWWISLVAASADPVVNMVIYDEQIQLLLLLPQPVALLTEKPLLLVY